MANSILRKAFLTFTILYLAAPVLFAQKTEVRANAYSGLFSFYGNGSASSTEGYLNPQGFYGRHPGFSYSFELQVQRITLQQHLYGFGLSIDKLKSKTKTTIYTTDIIVGQPVTPPEKATTILTNAFLNLNPFVGQRFILKKITLDVSAGMDLACYLKGYVIIKIPAYKSNDRYSYDKNKVTPWLDVRPRVQISAGYKRFGLLAGYSLGLINYQKFSDSKAYSSFLRMGISYKLR